MSMLIGTPVSELIRIRTTPKRTVVGCNGRPRRASGGLGALFAGMFPSALYVANCLSPHLSPRSIVGVIAEQRDVNVARERDMLDSIPHLVLTPVGVSDSTQICRMG